MNEIKVLNIVIDRDLEVLKILRECNHVFEIYLDVAHKVKHIKNNCPKFLPNCSATIY